MFAIVMCAIMNSGLTVLYETSAAGLLHSGGTAVRWRDILQEFTPRFDKAVGTTHADLHGMLDRLMGGGSYQNGKDGTRYNGGISKGAIMAFNKSTSKEARIDHYVAAASHLRMGGCN